ncbi:MULTISPECIES: wax ester/triacylglycerol synthase family O-acyltransferase [Amycolatopsis]|uniref:Diacylglycerol O-acyltransferase n=1 Tax=Amycolatopsis dongchuanensis TaxID=1070866 RepID=A0ABP8VDS2_9PSEU
MNGSDRLDPLAAAFLEIEDADPQVALAIGSVAVLEGPAPRQDEVVAVMAPLVARLAPYRRRVVRTAFGALAPVWAEDPHFDPAGHFYRARVPGDGTEAELYDLVALLMAERLPRHRPLWEFWVLEGLAGGRWAVLSKVHHSLADGVSGVHLHELVFAGGAPEPSRPAQPAPGGITPALRAAAKAVEGLGALASALVPVAPSSLTGRLGRQRRYEVVQTSLSRVAAIGHTLGATVNDVALAAITAGLRELLLSRGETPETDTVRALVPVSTHGSTDRAATGNRVSLLLPTLPVELTDPALRLAAVHRRLATVKRSGETEAGDAVVRWAGRAAFAPVAAAVRAVARLPQHSVVTVATNVPGPRDRVSLLGRKVLALHPYVPIALRLRVGVAMLSYDDHLSFGVTLDHDGVPEHGLLSRAIAREIAALSARAEAVHGRHEAVAAPMTAPA